MEMVVTRDSMVTTDHSFSPRDKRAFYRTIFERRDVRSQFLPDPIAPSVLARILHAAHHAPSVGFMQPWDFIIVRDSVLRHAVKAIFEQENAKAAACYEGERRVLYDHLKLEGILESPVNLCVTCHRTRGGPNVLGRNSIVETDLFSVCLAVQNLWLAARVEGIGVGWVRILDQEVLAETLRLPPDVHPVAYLCLGHVREFPSAPELESRGWRKRLPLSDLVHDNCWGQSVKDDSLRAALKAEDRASTA